ncbi:hypothetical protein AVEN_117141-1 [Araneus ventricosus]|uniref:Uncharacterized protein n=1 Tax=Araneus ventricosus TaxID=182803 RepID=A0A4Y2AX97_ARAVE|nr:hypothetical protein AVEN_117141-1 [Araneus ventricosus]
MKEQERYVLDFAKSMLDKDTCFGKGHICGMNQNLNYLSDGRIGGRKAKEELNEKLLHNVEHGGGGYGLSQMFCASGIGKFSFIENNMTQYKYPERKT